MDAQRVDEFYRMLFDHESEELVRIWQANDRGEWPAEAFEAIRRLLEERGVELPPQEPPRAPSRRRLPF